MSECVFLIHGSARTEITVLLADALIGSQGEDALRSLSQLLITKLYSLLLLITFAKKAVVVALVASLFVSKTSQKPYEQMV